jgi:O-antigen/teichoic acid export membrane protein
VRRGIRSMRLAIVAQAVLYLALAGFVWYLAAGVDDLGDVTWPMVVVSVNAALLVALVVFSVLLSRRERKVIFAIIGLECAFVAILLVGLIVVTMNSRSSGPSGAPAGLFVWGALVLAVLRPLQKPELRAAFGLRPIQPRQKKPKK